MSDIPLSDLSQSARLKWFHWLVLTLSLILTFSAWLFSKSQHEKRIEEEFNRDSKQIVEIIHERMNSYADSLWAGVAFFHAQDSDVTHKEWRVFAEALNLESRYPGIHGIGVIYRLNQNELMPFLQDQNSERPSFKIHPKVEDGDYWPITYIVPEKGNEEAIGLDISYEGNRLKAAALSAKTGEAKITGPITLVQDESHNPGFLFYAPIYNKTNKFIGHVYAPFVVSKLIYGVLLQGTRNINFSLSDNESLLYNEHIQREDEALYRTTIDLDLYGRTWKFDLRSSPTFEKETSNSQPIIILLGGFIIDGLLLGLFLSMSRSNKRAVKIAKKLASEAEEQRRSAEQASKLASLGEMAGGIAHEINDPLSVILSYSNILRELESERMPEESRALFNEATKKIDDSVTRITVITDGLRTFSRDGSKDSFKLENLNEICQETIEFAKEGMKNKGIEFKFTGSPFISVNCQRIQISQVLINLINNAKHEAEKSEEKIVTMSLTHDARKKIAKIHISNSGSQIPKDVSEKLFQPFFTTKEPGEGTGLGLSISKTIIDAHEGRLYHDSTAEMTTFIIEIPLA